MIRWTSGAVIGLVAAALTVAGAEQNPPETVPLFRSRATAVSLDVAVKRRNRPVAGLTTADFEVMDNGIRQQVEQAFANVSAIDVGLIVDASGSTARILGDILRNAQRILGLLRADDAARILVIDTHPYELVPLRPIDRGLALPVQQLIGGGASSIHDAILAGLVTRPDPDRRRLLIVITDEGENKSITSVQSLERVARRTDTVLHIISALPEWAADKGAAQAGAAALPVTVNGFIRNFQTASELDLFRRLPAVTGGVFHRSVDENGQPRDINVVAAIRDVIEEFRRSYVIQYTARGVATAGWHDVAVRVKGVDRDGVRTRAGYFGAVR